MKIRKKKILKVDKIQQILAYRKISSVRIAYDNPTASLLKKIGFRDIPKNGDSILPGVVGNISDFNANGMEIIRDDLPKEKRVVATKMWTWKQWCGYGRTETRSKLVDVVRDCYPRDFITPPSIEFIFKDNSLLSEPIDVAKSDALKHAINLFLEYFGVCDIRQEDGSAIIKLNRVNWELLPPGKQPFARIKEYVDGISNSPKSEAILVKDRQKKFLDLSPTEVYVGQAGFAGYIAYIFKKGVFLESVRYGNATYVFDKNWDTCSKMTKKEVLDNKLQKARIVHFANWEREIDRLFQKN